MGTALSESRFYMWRAVIAMIHADTVVRPHEVNFILENTRHLEMSAEQLSVLNEDIVRPANIDRLFKGITHPHDKEQFFHLARAIAWADGDMDDREREMINALSKIEHDGRDEIVMDEAFRNFADIYINEKSSYRTIQNEEEADVIQFIR